MPRLLTRQTEGVAMNLSGPLFSPWWEWFQSSTVTSATMGAVKQTAPKLTKHELKTRETRELLLQAAKTIFIRDGYENAELGEIATLAGRTKGAIYAQFKSKEDIFLALVESHALGRRAAMMERLERASTVTENLAEFRNFFLDFSSEETWGLLLLEFRLYALRHPEAKERMSRVYETIMPPNEEQAYAALLGPASKSKDGVSRTAAVHSAFGMRSALMLTARFAPEVMSVAEVEKIAGKVFDALFGEAKR
ncbi:MAG: TetR/AcrR family transcriptional regulator [Acidobacteriaceae bacterium]|nr:TetR/AcrR family transcriptional regulator [Acidobacteriaceae bacterium]